MLNVVTFLWGDKYGAGDVAKLAAGLKRHMSEPYRFRVYTDRQRDDLCAIEQHRICDLHLTKHRGCFARLRLFHPEWQAAVGYEDGDRIACVDLDVVVTGNLGPVLNRPEPFLILQGANSSNPCPYNGSVWMVRAGYRPDVWSDFSLSAAADVPFYEFPDDQAWLAHKLPGAPGWCVGSASGIYAFQKPGWPKGDALPKDARLVVFPGWRSPDKFQHIDWVKRHWAA